MVEAPARAADVLVATKLQLPVLRDDVVERAELLARLRATIGAHRLTLLSAPAGYGKTTLLSALGRAHPDLALTWLSLDEDDADPARFLGGLAAALGRLDPACGAGARAMLAHRGDDPLDVRRVVGTLVNDALERLPTPFAVVLDDLHVVVEPAVFAALDYLVERMPPQMHVVVASRHDPPLALARLRARGQLAELRAADLRFSEGETEAYLNARRGLGLPDEDVAALQARAEGWAAGLTLLAGSLARIDDSADRSAFVRRLSGVQRHVFDFLAEEVLDRQEAPLRDFLLRSSILAEPTAALCRAVAGRADAADLLDEAYRRGLFLTAVDGAGEPTYRFHHLFAAFLQARLGRAVGEEGVRGLHRLAAAAEPAPARAIRHWLAAGDWDAAADVVEAVAPAALAQGQLASLRGWIEALPGEVAGARPRLAYLLGLCAIHGRDVPRAVERFEAARRAFAAAGDAHGEGEALVGLAQAAFLTGEERHGVELATRALDCPLPTPRRVELLLVRALAESFQGLNDAAMADIAAAFSLADARDPAALEALLAGHSIGFIALPGGLDKLEATCGAAEELADPTDRLRLALEEQKATVNMYRGRTGAALAANAEVLRLAERLGGLPPWRHWVAFIGRAVMQAARGEPADVDALLELFDAPGGRPLAFAGFAYFTAHVCWLLGRVDDQRRVTEVVLAGQPGSGTHDPRRRGALEAKLALADGDRRRALGLLREVVQAEARWPTFNFFGSGRTMLAHALLESGRSDEALVQIEQALEECLAQGAPGRIAIEGRCALGPLRLAASRGRYAAEAARLLGELRPGGAAAAVGRPAVVPETGEALSGRELEVLALIADGASNRDVADRLVIAERTVKSHLTSIFAKLDVTSRTRAAARARELGLV